VDAFVDVLVPRPATMEEQKRWVNTAAWWIFVNGEKSIDARRAVISEGFVPPPFPSCATTGESNDHLPALICRTLVSIAQASPTTICWLDGALDIV